MNHIYGMAYHEQKEFRTCIGHIALNSFLSCDFMYSDVVSIPRTLSLTVHCWCIAQIVFNLHLLNCPLNLLDIEVRNFDRLRFFQLFCINFDS